MKAILILVDLQQDYLKDIKTQPHPGVVEQAASEVLNRCRQMRIPVAHIRTTVAKDSDRRMAHWKQNNLWRCVQGTEGHQPPPSLADIDGEYIIHKSGFDPFEDGQLRAILNSSDFDTAIICGLHLHACVKAVISGVFSAGLRVCVVDEAVGSNDPFHAAICRRYFEERTVRFIQLDDLETLAQTQGDILPAKLTDQQIEATFEAFRNWQKVEPESRIAIIRRFAENLLQETASLATNITEEIGKPIFFSRSEILRSAEMIDDIIERFQSLAQQKKFDHYKVRHVPLGTIAIITPWNNPVYIALGKIIPAILYGNTVIWKPSPKAVKISKRIMSIMEISGISNRIVSLIPGDRKIAIEILQNDKINGATFTGSLKAGYGIQELCAKRHIPVQAELGGNNAAIVWEDADIRHAAQEICNGAFEMAGQRCTANKRVIVHQKSANAFQKAIKTAIDSLAQGNANDNETRVGAMIDIGEKKRVLEMIGRAQAAGHEVYPGVDNQTNTSDEFVAPTLILCNDQSAEIIQEETFGPVLVMQVVKDWKEAIESCNGVRQGLVAAIFTQDLEIENRFSNEAKAGILKINQTTSDASVGAPFGGWKASGIGPAEHAESDREFYTRIQTVYRTSI